MKSAFINAKIFPIEGDIIENGTLIIEDNKIIAVGSDLSTNGCEVIDCSGKIITPGFIDAHSHVGLFQEAISSGSAASSDGNEQTDSITPYLRSMDAIFPEDMGFDDASLEIAQRLSEFKGFILETKNFGHVNNNYPITFGETIQWDGVSLKQV